MILEIYFNKYDDLCLKLVREAFKKKNGQSWESVQTGGGLPESQPLNRFLKKYSECPETHNKHIKHFSIFLGGRSDT